MNTNNQTQLVKRFVEVSMIGYHNSKHTFDKPCYEMIKKNRENHGNGNLGLWYSTTNSWQKGFGGVGYKLEVIGKELRMDFKDFQKLCYGREGVAFFIEQRDVWLSEGYSYLSIIEHSGINAMGIVLDLDAIVSWEKL
ncbi:MAG: hypothetical protein GY928_25045 [Colwellia sp.]|nr:hypothetical protein [Colwellia sp.]